ncbi:MAG: succinate dehydrogenase, cytochrome b556 subunit, partial [Polymorphobacter sp.]
VRPLSPHISIWKWRVTMAVSILHRATGTALAFGGVVLLLWWLLAAASGPDAYAVFYGLARGGFGVFVGVALSWVFFQHLLSGLRHLYMDSGAGYGLAEAKSTAISTFVGSVLLTVLTWVTILSTKGL